ncbi:ATP-dependent sacrificial sulfur transferase LarE [Candidatus Poriferisodalis sp.]|uniref:ATP-dependent sacrificial sulfur transferase LarE n=1 Tax=Candidatus Poriferisodalis sp. TaxID=3101277 RepID=UPI003B5A802C
MAGSHADGGLSVQDAPASAEASIGRLRAFFKQSGPVVVAFSGGVDSALVAWTANEVLGDDALCVTAVSASLASDEAADCAELAAEWGLAWQTVETDEMARAAYRANDPDRCFHCKSALMDQLEPLASVRDAVVVLGVNLDDLGDHRPGQHAARERGALFPLVEAGFAKVDVRRVSAELGLRTWDKPAAACLASRVPYGTQVTVPLLARLDRAEATLRRLGFRQLRVRDYGDTARIELPLDDLAEAIRQREALVEAVRAVGYRYVTLDLEGFRSGNLNGALASRISPNSASSAPEAG